MSGALENILSRPKTVITLMLVMVIAGILTYLTIPKEANPDIDVPIYYVSISQQGISPKDSERLLIRPMETQLRGLDGLKELTAIASEGHAGILLEFRIESDKDLVLADIRDKVDQGKAELPEEADEPEIFETNFALQPTIIVTLSGNVPERTLYTQARRLKDEIESIPTVREAALKGNREELLEVILDLEKLESYDITQTELLNALSNYNQLVPAGFLDDGQARFNLKLPGLVPRNSVRFCSGKKAGRCAQKSSSGKFPFRSARLFFAPRNYPVSLQRGHTFGVTPFAAGMAPVAGKFLLCSARFV